MRRAARKDVAHNPICEELEAHGIVVLDCSRLGDGFPDVLCYYPPADRWVPMEIKSDNAISKQSKSSAQLKPAQQKLHAKVRIPVVRSAAEALAWLGLAVQA